MVIVIIFDIDCLRKGLSINQITVTYLTEKLSFHFCTVRHWAFLLGICLVSRSFLPFSLTLTYISKKNTASECIDAILSL